MPWCEYISWNMYIKLIMFYLHSYQVLRWEHPKYTQWAIQKHLIRGFDTWLLILVFLLYGGVLLWVPCNWMFIIFHQYFSAASLVTCTLPSALLNLVPCLLGLFILSPVRRLSFSMVHHWPTTSSIWTAFSLSDSLFMHSWIKFVLVDSAVKYIGGQMSHWHTDLIFFNR